MWLSLVENPESIRAIYGNLVPELQRVYLNEVKVVNGEDIECFLRFDINILPEKLPQKWAFKKINTVQLDVSLSCSEIILFKTSGGNMIGDIEIILEETHKKLSFKEKEGDILVIRAKWITVRSITGYLKE